MGMSGSTNKNNFAYSIGVNEGFNNVVKEHTCLWHR
jgi:hypothetical protein